MSEEWIGVDHASEEGLAITVANPGGLGGEVTAELLDALMKQIIEDNFSHLLHKLTSPVNQSAFAQSWTLCTPSRDAPTEYDVAVLPSAATMRVSLEVRSSALPEQKRIEPDEIEPRSLLMPWERPQVKQPERLFTVINTTV